MFRDARARAGLPEIPPLRPTWTTWMWVGFAVAVLAATVIGMVIASGVRY